MTAIQNAAVALLALATPERLARSGEVRIEKIASTPNGVEATASTPNGVYKTRLNIHPRRGWMCQCPDAALRGRAGTAGPCKHILALVKALQPPAGRSLADFAKSLRKADWTAPMSDAPGVDRAHSAFLASAEAEAKANGPLWEEVFSAAMAAEKNITWVTWDTPSRDDGEIALATGQSRAQRAQAGQAWAQAYLAAHGIDATAASNLAGAPGTYQGGYSQCGVPNWAAIDAMIASMAA